MSPLLFKRVSDESLGSRLASGEAAAFDELYRRYAHRLAAYGSHLLGDAASGDDVAQAAMLKAYAALRDGRVPDRMKPWLYRIAHNVAIDLVARRRDLPSDDFPELPALEREPFAGALVEALATLPERQRRVYLLREVHGLRIDETAAELGLTAAQVEQSLFAARNRLAEQMVFGDRLNCVTVQRLASGPLDAPERRALKTHLRSCPECRSSLGVRGRALALVPSAIDLEWLRGIGAGLLTGGAPAAAKVGAVVATATIAAGVPVAVQQHRGHAKAPAPSLLVRPAQALPDVAPSREAVEVSALTAPVPSSRALRSGGEHEHGAAADPAERPGSAHEDAAGGGERSSGEGGSHEAAAHEAVSHEAEQEHTTASARGAEHEHTATTASSPELSSGEHEGSTTTTTVSAPGGDGGRETESSPSSGEQPEGDPGTPTVAGATLPATTLPVLPAP